MVCIVDPRNLVIVVMVTSVVAMVHSSDDMDVRYVTKGRPHPRSDNQDCQSVSNDPTINSKPPKNGDYQVCVRMSRDHQGGTEGFVKIIAKYLSGRFWSHAFPLGRTFVPANSHRCYTESRPYCEGDRVMNISIGIYTNLNVDGDPNSCSCDWFPSYIEINGPQECERYICHWGKQCCSDSHVGTVEFCPSHCTFGETYYEAAIRCELKNRNRRCN